jgi:hypothetical protein
MPAALVRRDYLARNAGVGELAEQYNVSPEAMGIRISVLGLAK